MKINFDHLIAIIFVLCVSFIATIFFYGCSAQYHLNKYQSKGGTCGVVDTVKIIDSFPILQRDTIIWRYYTRDSIIIVNDRVVPKTRQEVRYEYKFKRDTIRLKETIIKEVTKQAKEETKQIRAENRSPWVWVALGIIALIAIFLIKKQDGFR